MNNTTTLNRTMPDVRRAILAEMKRRGFTKYRMVQLLKGRRKDGRDVPSMTVYTFLRGETAINSDDLGLMMDVLEMDVRPSGKSAKR